MFLILFPATLAWHWCRNSSPAKAKAGPGLAPRDLSPGPLGPHAHLWTLRAEKVCHRSRQALSTLATLRSPTRTGLLTDSFPSCLLSSCSGSAQRETHTATQGPEPSASMVSQPRGLIWGPAPVTLQGPSLPDGHAELAGCVLNQEWHF